MEEASAWSLVTTGRQRMIGSRCNISGRNLSLRGLTGRERLSIILLQKVLPTMQASITSFCSACGPAPLYYTTHICFDLGQQPRTSEHCQRRIPFFASLIHVRPPKCYCQNMSSIKNRLAFFEILFVSNVSHWLSNGFRITGN